MDHCAGTHLDAFAKKDRAVYACRRVDHRIWFAVLVGPPDPARRNLSGQRQVHELLEHVCICPYIFLQGTDVAPVAGSNVPKHGVTVLEELRKDVVAPVDGLAGGDVLEDAGVEDVNASIDRVREDFAPTRLLKKTSDPMFLV